MICGKKKGINLAYVRQFFQMKGHQCPLAVHLFSILMLENIGHIAEYSLLVWYHTDQKVSHLFVHKDSHI